MTEEQKAKRASSLNFSVTNFPVVGIGASAGGLDAIRRLLMTLPENTGLAFVIVQHLAASQESMLPEILSRFTKMPVSKVESGMPIKPDNVYVIPSGKTMTISDGVLKLQPKGVSLKPIDDFLRSLAQERKTQAIGVVLSGTGTDGTEGLKFVKAEGGITFAQDPKSAQYPDMPRSAISAETVYFVLPPESLAEELIRIAKHPEIVRGKMEAIESLEGENEADIQPIFTLLKASFGVNFANYKKSTTNRRITRRMILNKIETLERYVEYLRTHKDELQALFDDMLIGVTGFFREPNTYALLREKVFSKLVEKKLPRQPIRVWIPGCSTGEEAYSVAMAIEEFLEEKNIIDLQIQIFGTDVNEKNVEKARRGIYLKTIEDSVSENRLKRFFTPVNGNYQVVKQIRDMCVFAKHDLTNDPPFSNLDLIVCRNLLIYFDAKLQERIIPIFHYGLKSNGYLVLGESESVGKFTYLFEPLTKKGLIYRNKIVQSQVDFQLEAPTPYSIRKSFVQPAKAASLTLLEKEVDRLLMSDYVPASLVLNSNLDVLVFRGKIDPFISVDAGVASLNVAKIVRKELRPILQTAVYRAKKGNKDVRETVRIEHDRQTKTVNIQIKPLRLPKNEDTFFLVLFEEPPKVTPSRQKTDATTQAETENAKDQQIRELSEDLKSTKQTLQTVIEQQEATNEELRSSMEELQSSNEELMSTNEELETAKEELQSTNEELTTLNDELKNRNQSLSLLNDDLANLMNNIDTAVVIVNNNFKIRRFTSSAQELLRLMPSDLDHPITDIRLGLPIENFAKLLSRIYNLETVRQEIQTEKGRWYQLRIRPYINHEKKIDGAVLSFADVTEIKKLEAEKQFYTENLEQQIEEQAGKLVESESLAAIGKTAGMVGHDIRNPLQSIIGELYLARDELNTLPGNDVKKNLSANIKAIEEQVFYINKIIEDLQAFARPPFPQIQEVDVEKTVKEIVSSIPVPKQIQVSFSIETGFPKLKLDESYLKRALTNLILNSTQAMSKGGKITITATCQNGKALLSVADTGDGMTAEVKNKLFTPLFTTKSKGQGFGLAVVKRLTETMGGTVTFESEEGKGSKFTLEFPLSK